MSGELILFVDDEPNIIQLARVYLEREGYQVEAVGDGRSASEAVDRPQHQLLVLVSLRVNLNVFSNAFFQTDKSRSGGISRGVGLGLTKASEIVLAHGGRINAYNRNTLSNNEGIPNQQLPTRTGSLFIVSLPYIVPEGAKILSSQ